MTLKEAIDKHGFGVILANPGEPHIKVYRPLAYSVMDSSQIIGEKLVGNSAGFSFSFPYSQPGWVLYEEQKEKVKRWLWAFYIPNMERWDTSISYFTEEEMKRRWPDYSISIRKIESTEMEFDE